MILVSGPKWTWQIVEWAMDLDISFYIFFPTSFFMQCCWYLSSISFFNTHTQMSSLYEFEKRINYFPENTWANIAVSCKNRNLETWTTIFYMDGCTWPSLHWRAVLTGSAAWFRYWCKIQKKNNRHVIMFEIIIKVNFV